MRLALALLLFACFASSARADPLDDWCMTARLPSSVAICSDPELRAIAVERQHAFDEARSRLSPDGQKALLADQSSWVQSYARACGLAQDAPPSLPLAPQIRECMARAGEARIAYLRAYGSPPPAQGVQPPTSGPTPPSPSKAGAIAPARIGPSFDCGQATQPLARMICASPWLSKLDLRFAQAYYALLEQVGPAGRSSLRQEAIGFTSSVATECEIPETGPARRTRHCVADLYRRQRSLWISRLQGPAHEEATRPVRQHVALQAQLQRRGFLPATAQIDGIYGPAVRSAILAWQGASGRPETGFLSNADAAALEVAPAEPKGIAPPVSQLAPPNSSGSPPPPAQESAPPTAPASTAATGGGSVILGAAPPLPSPNRAPAVPPAACPNGLHEVGSGCLRNYAAPATDPAATTPVSPSATPAQTNAGPLKPLPSPSPEDEGSVLKWIAVIAFLITAISCAAGYLIYRIAKHQQPDEGVRLHPGNLPTVGARAVVSLPIVNGQGKVRTGGRVWLAEGPNLPEGAQVIIKSVQGTRIIVEAANAKHKSIAM
jgi:uncharacterized protein/membrane protein implicated in regulation of membrane protease activity